LLLIGSAAVGLFAGSDTWMEMAMLNAVLLAVVSLI
jgi:hypothetical protein